MGEGLREREQPFITLHVRVVCREKDIRREWGIHRSQSFGGFGLLLIRCGR